MLSSVWQKEFWFCQRGGYFSSSTECLRKITSKTATTKSKQTVRPFTVPIGWNQGLFASPLAKASNTIFKPRHNILPSKKFQNFCVLKNFETVFDSFTRLPTQRGR